MSAIHHLRPMAPPARSGRSLRRPVAVFRSGSGRLCALLVGALLAACSTTPPPLRLHSLIDSQAAVARVDPAASVTPMRLVITPIRVPAAVDQPQWLVRRADDTLQLLEQDRWAAPLSDELKAAIRARLGARWNVVDAAVPNPGGPAVDGFAWRVGIEVLRLDARPAVDVQLEARWTLLAPPVRSTAVACSVSIVEPVNGPGTVAIAEAYRRATVRLADWIGVGLRAGERSNIATCGAAAAS